MKRYQLYLNPHAISIIDEIGEFTDISRSSLIRIVVDSVAKNLAKILAARKTSSKNYKYLDSLVGTIEIKGKKQVNFSERADSLYYKD